MSTLTPDGSTNVAESFSELHCSREDATCTLHVTKSTASFGRAKSAATAVVDAEIVLTDFASLGTDVAEFPAAIGWSSDWRNGRIMVKWAGVTVSVADESLHIKTEESVPVFNDTMFWSFKVETDVTQ